MTNKKDLPPEARESILHASVVAAVALLDRPEDPSTCSLPRILRESNVPCSWPASMRVVLARREARACMACALRVAGMAYELGATCELHALDDNGGAK